MTKEQIEAIKAHNKSMLKRIFEPGSSFSSAEITSIAHDQIPMLLAEVERLRAEVRVLRGTAG